MWLQRAEHHPRARRCPARIALDRVDDVLQPLDHGGDFERLLLHHDLAARLQAHVHVHAPVGQGDQQGLGGFGSGCCERATWVACRSVTMQTSLLRTSGPNGGKLAEEQLLQLDHRGFPDARLAIVCLMRAW